MPSLPSPFPRPFRRRALTGAGRAVGCLAAAALVVGILTHGAASPQTPRGSLAGAVIRPTLAGEASFARSRLAANLAAPHPGRPEALTHPQSDSLGSTFPHPAHGTQLAATNGPLGTDVSDHQGNVNWSAVVAAGDRFVWSKATEGTYYTDSTYFAQQYNGSYQAGLIRGAYHFAIPNDSTGAAQADFFVANGGGWSADGHTLPGMLDLENNPYAGGECYGLTHAQMVAWVVSFDNEYRRLTGRFPVLYTNGSFWDTCTGGSSLAAVDPLDVAAWGPSPSPLPGGWGTATVWQYTDANSLGYDGDMYLGSPAGLQAFAYGTGGVDPTGPVTTTTVPTTTSTTAPGTTSTTAPASTTTTTTPAVRPQFTTVGGATFTAGQAGSYRVHATGLPAATFSLAGAPTWLHISPATGTISGTPPPTAGGDTSFTVVASNRGGSTRQPFVLTVDRPPTVDGWYHLGWRADTSRAIAWFVGAYPGATVTVTGQFPPGVTSHGVATKAVVWGRPQRAGTYQFVVTATNAAGTTTHQVTVVVWGQP